MKVESIKVLIGCLLISSVFSHVMVKAALPSRFSGMSMLPSAQVERDIPYGSDPKQRLDVYRPEHPQNAPILLMVHGGAWMIGNKRNAAGLVNKLSRWNPKGYIVISTDYRLLPEADPWVQANDVAKALAFVQAKAASWGGDPTHVVLLGHSAGAHLVSLLASDPNLARNNGVQPWLGTISLDSAALNVESIMQAPHMGFYDQAFGSEPLFWRKVSPSAQLKQAPKPMLMVCSSQRIISCLQSRQFAAQINALGGQSTVLPVALSHAEINRNLGLSGEYTEAVDSFLHTLGLP